MPLAAMLANNAQMDGQSMFRETDAPDQDYHVGADRDSMINRTFGPAKTAHSVNGLQIMVSLVKQSHHALEPDNILLLISMVAVLAQHAKLDGK